MGLAQVSRGLAVCAALENAGSGTAQLGLTLEACPFPAGQQSCAGQMKAMCVLCQARYKRSQSALLF